MMKTIIFYTLIDCRTLEFLKDDGYTDDSLWEAIRFDTLQEAKDYMESDIDEEWRDNFFIYKARLACYFELMEKED